MKYIFLFATIVLFTSCNNSKETTQTHTKQNTDKTVLETSGSINDFAASYEGSINNKYEIVMQLTKTGNKLGGSYYYKTKRKAITLTGSITDDGGIELTEMSKEMITGMFYGKLTGTKIIGTWTNPDNSTSMPFEVVQTTIASMQNKGDVLSYAIGQYDLVYITGATGVNTMYDTYIQHGKWVSMGSANIGGQREGYVTDLNQNDFDLLTNLHVTVDDNRGVHLYAGLIELFNSPFKAQGMDYRVTQKDKTKLHERMAALSEDTVLYTDKYVLLADDHVNYSKTLHGNFELVTEDNLILTYIPAINSFEVEIFLGACCDTAVLTFKR